MSYKKYTKEEEATMAQRNRKIVQAEINGNPLQIDRTVFSKTKQEHLELKLAKKEYKESV